MQRGGSSSRCFDPASLTLDLWFATTRCIYIYVHVHIYIYIYTYIFLQVNRSIFTLEYPLMAVLSCRKDFKIFYRSSMFFSRFWSWRPNFEDMRFQISRRTKLRGEIWQNAWNSVDHIFLKPVRGYIHIYIYIYVCVCVNLYTDWWRVVARGRCTNWCVTISRRRAWPDRSRPSRF